MTGYEVVFKPFLRRIRDPFFGEVSVELSEDEMVMILNSAILRFNYPKVDLKDKDDHLKIFNQDLGFDEIQILSIIMALEWLTPFLNDVDLLKDGMSSREYSRFSKSAHIVSLRKLQENSKADLKKILVDYSKRTGNSSALGKLRGV